MIENRPASISTVAHGPATAANRMCALTLYRQLAAPHAGENLWVAPYSISSTLAMILVGARGPTADQIADVLAIHHLPSDTVLVLGRVTDPR
ncbi:MAG: hypothetical protein GC159_10595 [Phycisphaera sp.]|nr:hypothetical protein [Phycisphaera sp.]